MLSSLLPAEIGEVLARQESMAADGSSSVKSCLIRKVRLSLEAFFIKVQRYKEKSTLKLLGVRLQA